MMSGTLGRVKACVECRQQKVRCDAYIDYTKPCSRCKVSGLRCIISNNFQRRKRQSKRDLQREIEQLKQTPNLRATTTSARPLHQTTTQKPYDSPITDDGQSSHFPIVQQTHTRSNSLIDKSTEDQGTACLRFSHFYPQTQNLSTVDQLLPAREFAFSPILSHSSQPSECLDTGNTDTTPQSLFDVNVSGKKIDECYALFHKHYAPMIVGIFDPKITPNQRYQQSAVLFWVIVYTGARQYTRDPTIYERLSKCITNLVFSSLSQTGNAVPILQALLILCTWPVPVDTLYRDHSHALAGAGMHMAIQNGLHVFCHEEDFAKQPSKRQAYSRPLSTQQPCYPTRKYQDPELRFRACLWIHCLITFQRTSLGDGLPIPVIPESKSLERRQELHSLLPASLSYQYKVHRIQTDAVNTIGQYIELDKSDIDSTLHSWTQNFDDRIQEVDVEIVDDIVYLVRCCSLLSVRAFQFFVSPAHVDQGGIMQLYTIARDSIGVCSKMDDSGDFSRYMSQYLMRIVLLAAFCILRISKSSLRGLLPRNDAEETFFHAVSIAKKRSVQDNDLDSRSAKMLTQLWSSENIFRDGEVRTGLQLDLRGRSFMSVVFDCFWWWRAEFGDLNKDAPGQNKLVVDPSNVSTSKEALPYILSELGGQDIQGTMESMCLESENMVMTSDYFSGYPDWDWAATL